MGKKFLIDTNVLIDAQIGRLPENGLKFLLQTINAKRLIILQKIFITEKRI